MNIGQKIDNWIKYTPTTQGRAWVARLIFATVVTIMEMSPCYGIWLYNENLVRGIRVLVVLTIWIFLVALFIGYGLYWVRPYGHQQHVQK